MFEKIVIQVFNKTLIKIVEEVDVIFFYFCRRLCVDHENVRPDLVILGKALSGGVFPVSL